MAAAGPIPMIVGALRCQQDSYLQSLETEVVSCSEYTPPKETQQAGKPKTKKSTDPTKGMNHENATASKTWLIEFADSVLFPEGGGQPTDHGTITPLSDGNQDPIPISNIQRHGLRCIHFSPTPLEAGTKVRQTIDATRRWDHMQQHTGQHLLSAIMDTLDLPTLSWNLAPAGEINSIELPRKPSDSEIQTIQTRCNEAIRNNLPITVETPAGKTSNTLPADYDHEKGTVRFIKIGDLDYNACCGTHLKQTSHIGVILLHHTQSVRGTHSRLFFTAGDRAIRMAALAVNGLRDVAVSLSCAPKPADVAGSVQRLGEQVAEARKREKKMLGQIAGFEGERIRGLLERRERVFWHRAGDGLDFINLVVFEVRDVVRDRGVVVLCSGEEKGAGSIVIVGESELVDRMAVKVKEVVSMVRGGGKGKWQGKVVEWQKGEVEALKKAVEDD